MHMQSGMDRTELLRGHRSARGAQVSLQLEQLLQGIQCIRPRAPRYSTLLGTRPRAENRKSKILSFQQ